MSIEMSWVEKWELENDQAYISLLNVIDPSRVGVGISCPNCGFSSWVLLHEKRYGPMPLHISCGAPCGYYGPIESFRPRQLDAAERSKFEVSTECRRDQTILRVNGPFYRCPVCAYENSREIMRELTAKVTDSLALSSERDVLVDMLSRIVSTFDGVMRACNRVAVQNKKAIEAKIAEDPNLEHLDLYPIDPVTSFQNLKAANDKMQPHWDMAAIALDWPKFVQAFQKRHCFAHSLGVADQRYLDIAQDSNAVLGQQIRLTADEVLDCAKEAENIVAHFFGRFFS